MIGPDGRDHDLTCPQIIASTARVPIECEHGNDCCPECDACTCQPTKETTMGNLYRKLRAVIHEAAVAMKRKRRVRKVVLRASCVLLLAPSAQAITNGWPLPAMDPMLDAVGAYAVTWRLGLEPSNPGNTPNAWYCAATLVAPDRVALAVHCVTPYGTSAPAAVRFRRRVDGGCGTIAGGPSSFFHALISSYEFPGGDLAYATLAEPVTHIQPIPLSQQFVYSDGGTDVMVAGWGKQGPVQGEGPATELRATWVTLKPPMPEGAPYRVFFTGPYDYPNGLFQPPSGTTGVNKWDSGAPVLVPEIIPICALWGCYDDWGFALIGVVAGYNFGIMPGNSEPVPSASQQAGIGSSIAIEQPARSKARK